MFVGLWTVALGSNRLYLDNVSKDMKPKTNRK